MATLIAVYGTRSLVSVPDPDVVGAVVAAALVGAVVGAVVAADPAVGAAVATGVGVGVTGRGAGAHATATKIKDKYNTVHRTGFIANLLHRVRLFVKPADKTALV
jgi:hypothetical protein